MSDDSAQDSEAQAPGKPFKKGQSGNPGGQPAWVKKVRDSLKKCSPLAVRTLKDVMRNGPDKERVRAAAEVLKYVVPAPKQRVKVERDGKDPLASLSPEELVAFIVGKK